MSEPASTAAGSAWALGAVTITGTLFGLHFEALALGFAGALVALFHLPPVDGVPRTPFLVFGFVASASFAAGIFAPLAALFAAEQFDLARGLSPEALRGICAAIIGATTHLVIPAVRGLVPLLINRFRGGAR